MEGGGVMEDGQGREMAVQGALGRGAALEPGAETAALEAVIALAGVGRISLRDALAAWQREQDRLLNRAWRRPGGLVRPGGV